MSLTAGYRRWNEPKAGKRLTLGLDLSFHSLLSHLVLQSLLVHQKAHCTLTVIIEGQGWDGRRTPTIIPALTLEGCNLGSLQIWLQLLEI